MNAVQIVDLLNEIAAADPKCISELIEKRVLCSNTSLLKHPTVVVVPTKSQSNEAFSAPPDPRVYLGVLGIINGIAALDGVTIEAVYDGNKRNKVFTHFRLREQPESKKHA